MWKWREVINFINPNKIKKKERFFLKEKNNNSQNWGTGNPGNNNAASKRHLQKIFLNRVDELVLHFGRIWIHLFERVICPRQELISLHKKKPNLSGRLEIFLNWSSYIAVVLYRLTFYIDIRDILIYELI